MYGRTSRNDQKTSLGIHHYDVDRRARTSLSRTS
jgi:hypothetical protein